MNTRTRTAMQCMRALPVKQEKVITVYIYFYLFVLINHSSVLPFVGFVSFNLSTSKGSIPPLFERFQVVNIAISLKKFMATSSAGRLQMKRVPGKVDGVGIFNTNS